MIISKVRLRNFLLAGVVIAVGWLIIPDEQKARFETMGEDNTSQARFTYWRRSLEVAADNPLFGVGYQNWFSFYEEEYGVRRMEVHNSTLEGAVELGIPAAALFLAMVALSFRMNFKTRRRARGKGDWGTVFTGMAWGLDAGMVALFLAGQFMSVLFYPMYWMAFGLTVALSEVSRQLKGKGAGTRPRRIRGARRPLQVGAHTAVGSFHS
jgi:O-antigen ligase